MNTLLSIRTNIIYAKKVKKDKKEPDEFEKFQELIFLVDKPSYIQTNEGEIIRQRGVEEMRFTVSEKAFEQLITLLSKIKDVEESDLQ